MHGMMQYWLVLLFFLRLQTSSTELTLSVIHFNDFHARYEPVSNLSSTCKGTNCIGGFSRLYSMINELVQERPNAILLNAGDNYKGSLWHIVHRWKVATYFLNKLPLDAITLGNHEFDHGIDGLVPYLRHVIAPIVVSNLDDSKEPRIQNLYRKSVVVTKNNRRIGIIGVILSTTNIISQTENLRFLDEATSIDEEAKRLDVEEHVFSSIVVSHCGYEADINIAKKLTSKISIIVGGHTDTLLYSGSPIPGPDKPLGPYPTIVLNRKGHKVLVVQASAYSKYLGNLSVTFDDFGNLTRWSGNPIFLDHNVARDEEIDAELEVWRKPVEEQGSRILGRSLFTMPNRICREKECLLGDFATDAMVFAYINNGDKESWTEVAAAIIHAGGLRAGLESGNITFNDLTATFPFEETIDMVELKGAHIQEILEGSVDNKHLQYPHMFQISGIQVVYNISKLEGERVQSLKIRCDLCKVPKYEAIVPEKYYKIALPAFLTNTGFNPLFNKYLQNKVVGNLDSDVYSNYLSKRSPIMEEVGNRIQIVT